MSGRNKRRLEILDLFANKDFEYEKILFTNKSIDFKIWNMQRFQFFLLEMYVELSYRFVFHIFLLT